MRALGALALALAFAAGRPVAGQASLFLVNDSTTVGAVGYRFDSTQTFTPAQLQLRVATRGPSGVCERGLFAAVLQFLPFCGDPGLYPFNPVELQKDVRRVERFYRRNGFPYPAVDYLVRLDTTRNRADVLFTIAEGPPIVIDTLRFSAPNAQAAVTQLDGPLREDWVRFRERITLQQGERLDDFRLLTLQNATLRWLRERGYAFAQVTAQTDVDTSALRADVTIKLDAGPLARYGAITIVGLESVDEQVVLRELPFVPGDEFRQSELTEGQRQVFGLALFQLAAVDIVEGQPRDSTVDLRVTVREGPQRVADALVGFYDRGGLTARGQWTNRNFLGGARTFTAALTAQTGLGAFASRPARNYVAQVTLRQPYVFNRRFSATASPYLRQRSDDIEASREVGFNAALLYEAGALRNASLGYTLSARRVDSTAVGGLLNLGAGGLLDADSLVIPRNELRLSGTLGRTDDPLNPRAGVIFRPYVAASGPPFSNLPYGLAGATLSGFLPFGQRAGVVARVSATTLAPFGRTDIDDPDDPRGYFGTRDVLAYAGGTGDVRGWGSNGIGPLFFDIQVENQPRLDSINAGQVSAPPADEYYADVEAVRPYYAPVGSRGKVSASVQANLPLPLANFGASVFVDAGRTWGPAEFIYNRFGGGPRFGPVVERFREEADRLRVGAGAGLQYLTPVGYLNLALGVKLNPSYFDLRDPRDVWREIDVRGLDPDAPDLEAVPENWLRRLQIHLTIGQSF